MGYITENTLTLREACGANANLNTIYRVICRAVDLKKIYPDLYKTESRVIKKWLPKQAQEFMEYQHFEAKVDRKYEQDRTFPMETVEIQRYRGEHEAELEEVMIHTGPYADELARSLQALAVTIGKEIYFRNNAYQPESEEGRSLLAHEMTHVAQYTEGRITQTTTRETLEAEAEHAEAKAVYEDNPYIRIPVGRNVYRVRRSELGRLVKMTADGIEGWLEEQKSVLEKTKYLAILYEFERWLGEQSHA